MANAIRSSYQWPANPKAALGLEASEIQSIEQLVTHIRRIKDFTKHLSYTIDRNTTVLLEGKEIQAPRRLVIYKTYSLVVLNRKGGAPTLSGGGQQRILKLAYDPDTGTFCVKKKIFGTAQALLIQYLFSKKSSLIGCADIRHIEIEEREGKSRYFEKYYAEGSLSRYFKNHARLPRLDPNAILLLQDTMKALHEIRYRPPALESPAIGKAVSYEPHFYCSHSDVSPNNLVVEPQLNGSYLLKWIDWGSSVKRSSLRTHTIGWGAPETIQDREQPSPQVAKDKIDVYGTKKDTWSFALLAGSILLGGFHFHVNAPSVAMPAFRFIHERIRVDPRGGLHESALKTLTQEEIDRELHAYIVSSCKTDTPLWRAIQQWLRVNPNERPNLATSYVEEDHVVSKAPLQEELTPEKKRSSSLEPTSHRSSLSVFAGSMRRMLSFSSAGDSFKKEE